MKRPDSYAEIESVQEVMESGAQICFISDEFWYGRCVDDGCHNLHVFCREINRPYEVATTFSCQQLEDMLHTARLIKQRHGN